MPYSVGVDLGTTFTSVAINRGDGARPFELTERFVVPSAAFRSDDGTLLTGQAAVDAAVDPSRLVVGFKRRLGDPTPIVVGGSVYSAESLMAAQLRDVLELVEAAHGEPPENVVLTYPAVWGPYRREQFLAVAKLAGIASSSVVTEPVAAATHLIEDDEQRLTQGDVVAVYDLGGGTLDITLLRVGPAGLEILGSPEGVEHLGGMDFDDALLALVDERLSGRVGLPGVPVSTRAEVARACTRAKEELSVRESVDVDVTLSEGTETLTITRVEFERAIEPLVDLSVATLRRVIASAGLGVSEVAAIMLAGSSSRIPVIGERVSELGPPVHLTHHPKLTVSLGAASSSWVAERDEAAEDAALPTRPVDSVAMMVRAPAPDVRRRTPVVRRRLRSVLGVAASVLLLVGALTLSTSLQTALGPGAQPLPSEATISPETTLVPAPDAVALDPPWATTAPATGDDAQLAEPGAQSNDPSGPASDRSRFTVFDAEPAQGLTPYIESGTNGNENWSRTPVRDGGANRPQLTVSQEGVGLRTVWRSSLPAQLYFQTSTGSLDVTPYADADGALVFDVDVHSGRAQEFKVGAHCGFPCGGTVDLTGHMAQTAPGTATTVAVPASCLRAAGLDTGNINTPFLVLGSGSFDVTISHVRWEANAASDPGAVRC